MKTKRFTEAKIMHILQQAEKRITVLDLCREYGMSSVAFTNGVLSTAGWTRQRSRR